MNQIKKEILNLLYYNQKGLRTSDLIKRVSILRNYGGDLRVNSRAYKILIAYLNMLKRKYYIKKIRYDWRDRKYTADGQTYWVLTNYARKHQTSWLREQGII